MNRFKKLLSSFDTLEEVAEITDLSVRSFQFKRDGDEKTSIKKSDILTLERAAQIKDDRLVCLMAKALCRRARLEFINGRNYRKPPQNQIEIEYLDQYVEDNYKDFVEEACKVIDESIFLED